jgi:hypothetical protein
MSWTRMWGKDEGHKGGGGEDWEREEAEEQASELLVVDPQSLPGGLLSLVA